MSFYATLLINVSSIYNENTQSNFTTDFLTPLYFSTPYKVCLEEVTFRDYMSYSIGSIRVKFQGDILFRPLNLYAFDNEPLEHLVKRLNFEIVEYFTKLAYLSDHFINTVDKIDPYAESAQERVKKEWEKVEFNPQNYKTKYNEVTLKCPQFKPNESHTNDVTIHIPSGTQVEFTDYSKSLFNVVNTLTEDHSFLFSSELLNFFDYLMIYCDIIEQQYVGDTCAQLLGTVTKTSSFNTTLEKSFVNPHYLNVNKTYINSININIRDPTGSLVRFENKLSKVLIKLHFKPVTNE
jgi:hypothetical protein